MTRKPGAAGAARETLRVETPDLEGAGVPLHADPDAGARRTAPRPPSWGQGDQQPADDAAGDRDVVPLARCREILGARGATLDDDQVLAIRATVLLLADLAREIATASRLRPAA